MGDETPRRSSRRVPFALVATLASLFSICCSGRDAPHPSDAVVSVNGVQLHYVDWGGAGEWLLFLTPLGGDLHEQFDTLAPLFTTEFRVVGLTRRGQAPSEKPAGGYDQDTLAQDIVGFLDAVGARSANVAAHSMGGAEMTRLAVLHPSRVAKLVYLDAAVDHKLQSELAAAAGMELPPDEALAAIARGASVNHPDYASLTAPALNIAVVFDGPIPVRPDDPAPYKAFLKLAEQRDVVGTQVRRFQSEAARGQTLILRNTTHAAFLSDPVQQRIFVPVMREFLLRR